MPACCQASNGSAHCGAELQGTHRRSVFFVLSGFIMTYVYYGEDRYEPTRPMQGASSWHDSRASSRCTSSPCSCACRWDSTATTARIQVDALPQHFLLLQEFSPFGYFGSCTQQSGLDTEL